MTPTSRRAILAGIALASTATAPVVVATAAAPDPIFALIAECNRLRAIGRQIFETQYHPAEIAWFADRTNPGITNAFRDAENLWNAANDVRWSAEIDVLHATPTTLAGALAQLQFGADYVKDNIGLNDWEDTHALISNVATFLARRI